MMEQHKVLEPRAGPSGMGKDSNEKPINQMKTRPILKTEKTKEKARKKKKTKISSETPAERERRVSLTEQQTLRYKVPARNEGHQQSHTVRNLVPKAIKQEEKPGILSRFTYAYEVDEPPPIDRGHAAVDFYNKTSPYTFNRDSLTNIRKTEKKPSRFRLFFRAQSDYEPTHQKHHLHERRCQNCLHLKEECVCDALTEKTIQTDWAILTQRRIETPKQFTENQLNWLTDLEQNSKVNRRVLAEKKFDRERDICCCPFNTFRIFSKQDMVDTDYYMKK